MAKKIGCAGIIVEDTICGPMKALPREGELLALEGMPVKVGGCSANVAIDLAKQGVDVDIACCVGRDASGEALRSSLEQAGVGCANVAWADGIPTSKTVILLVEGQDRRFIHVFGSNRGFRVEHIRRSWVEDLDIRYLGGLFVMPAFKASEFLEILKLCRERRITTVVDVVLPQDWNALDDVKLLLPHIDYFLPNNDEARVMTGKDDPFDQVRALIGMGAHTVIITQGKAGALAGRGHEYWKCGTYPVTVVDPSGSGDAFSAGILTGLHHAWDMARTLRYASALGASATRAPGTTDSVYTAAEAEAFVVSHPFEVTTGRL